MKRRVMIDGLLTQYHEVTRISHTKENTTLTIDSWKELPVDGEVSDCQTVLNHELEIPMTFEQAEEWAWQQPEFAEYVDPYHEMLDDILPSLTDEQAEIVPNAWPGWKAGVAYEVDDRVADHSKVLYRCVQAHTSQADWEPSKAPSLWVRTTPGDVVPEWVQPTGAHDAYHAGDVVMHKGSKWRSTIDSNVWEPGVYGWVTVLPANGEVE